jgi:hypothetical protein
MEAELADSLRIEANKHIRRYAAAMQQRALHRKRYEKRTGTPAKVSLAIEPAHWKLDQQFDPFYVRSHLKSLSCAVCKSIRSGQYASRPALRIEVPKQSGGTRQINMFTIVDSAVSTWLFKNLLERNAPSFSAYSYAYRVDRNAHHAIQYLARVIRSSERLFMLEYDFARYFDSVSHDYLREVLEAQIKASPTERKILEAFLKHRYACGPVAYCDQIFETSKIGFPQGATISLFFANVACLDLDRQIERTGAAFARYADDIAVLCEEYAVASKLARIMLAHSSKCGAEINLVKSEGISLVSTRGLAEFKTKPSFVFLGHEISSNSISPAPKSVGRLKRQVIRIVYKHLLLYPKKGKFNPNRIAPEGFDWDLVTCVNEIRRLLYGRISARHLAQAVIGESPASVTNCALSYFPLVDNPATFRTLDGWLLDIVYRAYEKRRRVVSKLGSDLPAITRDILIEGSWYHSDVPNETSLPSFMMAWRYIRKCFHQFGLKHFPAPPPYSS